jgi:hypothetical protein
MSMFAPVTRRPNSREIIVQTLRDEQDDITLPDAEALADAILKALAQEHLHIFTSRGLSQ